MANKELLKEEIGMICRGLIREFPEKSIHLGTGVYSEDDSLKWIDSFNSKKGVFEGHEHSEDPIGINWSIEDLLRDLTESSLRRLFVAFFKNLKG